MQTIFSTEKLASHKNYAFQNLDKADFLFAHATKVLAERFKDINRVYKRAVILGDLYVDQLAEALKETGKFEVIEIHSIINETLGFEAQSQECLISFMDLHHMNDLPGVLIQARRALKPDGIFMGAMIGGETLYEAKQAFQEVELEKHQGASMHFHPYADKQQMGGLMQRAGFALPVIDSDVLDVGYKTLAHLLEELDYMGEGFALTEERPVYQDSFLSDVEAAYRKKFADPFDAGRIQSSFELVYLLGWSPHDNQQKPLKPGSAKHSLADTLDAQEVIINAED
jgi:SAM-dependent methyltransferase